MGVEYLPQRAQLQHEAGRGEEPAGSPLHVSERVLASWRRSEDYGVPLESIEPAFTGTYDDESLFFECGRAVLTELHRTLENEPISLMLTDADGLVLNRLSGDTALLRALDAVHLAPGFAYAERTVGTNGLGLALADRVPTVVRAEEHYSMSLCTYTCAAVPVLDPVTGRVEGAVNLTTWSKSSSDLLLALAQSAAGNTAALMLARSRGSRPRSAPRGQVFRVEVPRLEPGSGTIRDLSPLWGQALAQAEDALTAGRTVAAVGETGSGRATLVAQALRRLRPRDRILAASIPAAQDVDAWLELWTPELGKPDTSVVVRDVDLLPAWAAQRLHELVTAAGGVGRSGEGQMSLRLAVTAQDYRDIPAPLCSLVETVVAVAPLRERSEDVVALARHAGVRARGREVEFTPAALTALMACGWPGNVAQLQQVVCDTAARTDVIDVRHLPADVVSRSSRRLSRIEAFERDEIVRVLSRPGTSMRDAAQELGMSRATIYRKLAQYDIHLPRG